MAQSTASLVSTDDASINAASTGARGNWGDVEVYGKPGGGIVGLFKFALPMAAGDAPPHVASASLRLWVTTIHNGGGVFFVHAASGSWSEGTVTYGNGPSRGALLTSVSITSANRFYDIDLTAHIASRMAASASSATIWIEGGTDYKKFECHSRRDDRANPPTLLVVTSSSPSGGCERPTVSPSPLPAPPPVGLSSPAPPPSASQTPLGDPPPSPSPYPPVAGSQFELDWESGFPDGTPHLSPRGVEPSFSFNGDSKVVTCSSSTSDSRRRCKCGENGYSPYRCEVNYGMSDLHYQEMLTVPWARKGNGVLKFYADGRNAYGQGSGDSSFRCELGAPQDEFIFGPGDETYVSSSFWLPGDYWDAVTKYSTVITQFKMHSNPHGEVRLSNRGDYELFYRNAHGLWDDKATGDDGAPLGKARRNAWNDIKIYCKHSTGSDGRVRVYLNGEKKFEHYGATLHGLGNSRGYLKFGMYTEIRCADERRSNYHPSQAHAPCLRLFCLH